MALSGAYSHFATSRPDLFGVAVMESAIATRIIDNLTQELFEFLNGVLKQK